MSKSYITVLVSDKLKQAIQNDADANARPLARQIGFVLCQAYNLNPIEELKYDRTRKTATSQAAFTSTSASEPVAANTSAEGGADHAGENICD